MQHNMRNILNKINCLLTTNAQAIASSKRAPKKDEVFFVFVRNEIEKIGKAWTSLGHAWEG